MKNEMKNYKVTIFGVQYSLKSDDQEEQVVQAASFVDFVMRDIVEKSGLQDKQKVSVLASLQIAQEKTILENLLTKNSLLVNGLIQRLDHAMDTLVQLS
jgi:cell division protein ZapA (FtsZ GTPase activity inhibitor)